mmetsp:Transcript_4625/g.11207  ORF Transcript_4625/g.11207 Transcript_4625/m.11207 type:complete len:390 (-) Transcript_4625:521-1690(-)
MQLRSFSRPVSRNRSRPSVWIICALLLGLLFGLLRSSGRAVFSFGKGPDHSLCQRDNFSKEADGGTMEVQRLAFALQNATVTIDQLRKEISSQSKQIEFLARQLEVAANGDRHTPWTPSAERDGKANDKELAGVLRKVSLNGELLVAVSNMALAGDGGMLETFVRSVQAAGIPNAMVVAIDDATVRQVSKWGMVVHKMSVQLEGAQKKLGMSNHGVSGMKFRILRTFVELGYAVLLSDVDVVMLRNPFHHLRRDCDVEAMSDGWDNATAYGFNDVYDDPSMGWARFAHSMRQVVFNSGLFYLRPTQATLEFLDLIISRLERESAWDQAVFNEESAFPSSPSRESPHLRFAAPLQNCGPCRPLPLALTPPCKPRQRLPLSGGGPWTTYYS